MPDGGYYSRTACRRIRWIGELGSSFDYTGWSSLSSKLSGTALNPMVRIFGHYVSKSFVSLGIVEALLLALMLCAGNWLRFIDSTPSETEPVSPLWFKALVYSVVVILAMIAVGLYHRDYREPTRDILLRLVIALGLASLAMSILFYAFPSLYLGRGAFAYAVGLSLLVLMVARVWFYRVADRDTSRRRVLVIGTGDSARKICDLKHEWPQCQFNLIGFVRILEEEDSKVPAAKILSDGRTLLEIVNTEHVDEIILSVRNRWQDLPVEDMLESKLSGVRVTDLLTFLECETGRINLEMLYPSWLIFSQGFDQGYFQQLAKRVFDVLVSLLLVIVTLPLMLLTTVAIWLESGMRGPILYRQVRVGKDWELIRVMKFRSMRTDAEKGGVAVWAKKDDDRVTRVGRVIRKLRIDELPQLFNVLKGEMSFVGPRPERPEFVEKLAQSIPYYNERLRIKPGITGWAQVRYQYASSEEDAYNKLEYDLYYVKNHGIFMDFLILLYTAEVVLWRKGAV